MKQIRLNQIQLGPYIPLGRQGCFLEEGKLPYTKDFYDGTPLESHFKSLDLFQWLPIRNFVKERFVDILSICRKIHSSKFVENNELDKILLRNLINYKILSNDYKLIPKIESFGNLFECLVGYALYENEIQSIREAKIRYPFPNKQYDPDGQLYDILAALDISRLLWIECKKPLYLTEENPLGQVISRDNIQKFLRRAFFLKPDIAIYLVDTKDDYKEDLKKLFSSDYLTSGNYIDYFDESNNIIARVNGFIYFNRVYYKSNSLFYSAVKDSINQVLYDATKLNGEQSNLDILKRLPTPKIPPEHKH